MDLGHANIGNDDITSIIKNFYNKLVGISISNNNAMRDQHVNILRGTINYNQIISTLIDLHWSGYVAIEVRDVDPAMSLFQLYKLCQEIHK